MENRIHQFDDGAAQGNPVPPSGEAASSSPDPLGRICPLQPAETPADIETQPAGAKRQAATESRDHHLGAPSLSPVANRSQGVVQTPDLAGGSFSDQETREANERGQLCDDFLALMESGEHSLRTAAALLGKSPSWFSGTDSMLARYQRGGVAALLPRSGGPAPALGDLSKQIEALPWFIPAARFFYTLTNRTRDRGSVPEAIRRTLSLPILPEGWTRAVTQRFLRSIGCAQAPGCPEGLRESCLAREKSGQPLVPARIARQVTVPAAVIRQYRNPRETALDYLNSPGHQRLNLLGQLAHAGEIFEADDATINFPVCVPWERDGSADPCIQKYGVKVARFQWLVAIDVGTSYIPGFSYTARPRASYRAEDIVSLMRHLARAHGIPRRWRFERGAWESRLVKNAIQLMGSSLQTVYSPHAKPFIEGLFNTLWTKLSVHFPGAHVGRFRGEEREASLLLTACQTGAKDPRRYFPMIGTAIAAFMAVIAEKNRTPVNSAHHGRWIPEERWLAETSITGSSRREEALTESDSALSTLHSALRPLDPAMDWLFAPFIRDWTVKGMLVGGRVPVFDKLSIPFDFSAPWLPHYDGARVRAHFDPSDPRCTAKLVLLERFRGPQGDAKAPGTVLGDAHQVNSAANYLRLVMGWGDDADTQGLKARQATAHALRRELRAVLPRGTRGPAASEQRDGLGNATTIEVEGRDGRAATSPASAGSEPTPEAPARAKREHKPLPFLSPSDYLT